LTREPKVSFLHGAFILAGAAMISRVLGAVYRIPLTRLIGDYGIGLYGAGYNIYGALYAITTIGINVAISKLVAEKLARDDEAGAQRVFRISVVMMFLAGLVAALFLAVGARPVADLVMRNPEAFYAIIALSPAILLASLQGSLRGYFQGYQWMAGPAVSQIIEQLFRVGALLALAYFLLPRGPGIAAGGAALGAAVGAVAGLAYLLWIYARARRGMVARLGASSGRPEPAGPDERFGVVVRRIFGLAVPISIAGVVVPLMGLVDLLVVPLRLQSIGFSVVDSTRLFGWLSQMGMALLNLPTVVTLGLQTSLVPAVAEAAALEDRAGVRSRTSAALRATLLVALPATVGLWVLARPISGLLFNVPEAGVALSAMSSGVLFLMLQQTSSGVLQGVGRTDIPVRNLIIGAMVKTAFAWTLTAVPALNVRGAAYGTAVGFGLAALLNLVAVNRLVGLRLDLRGAVVKPAAAAGVMGLAAYGGYRVLVPVLGSDLSTLVAVAGGALIYGVVLLLVGAVRERDFALVPRIGPRLGALLKRAGLVRG
jgi:stage V sporulation protein B